MKFNDALVRVRYAETDTMGFVYHTNYLVWFEVGRAEYMRAAGVPYKDLEALGICLPVVECGCQFHHPGRYDDLLTIRTSVAQLSRVKLGFAYEVLRCDDGQMLAEGFTVHAFTDPEGRPTRHKADSVVWQRILQQVEIVPVASRRSQADRGKLSEPSLQKRCVPHVPFVLQNDCILK